MFTLQRYRIILSIQKLAIELFYWLTLIKNMAIYTLII